MNEQTNKQKEQTDTGQPALARWEGLDGRGWRGGLLRGVNGQFRWGAEHSSGSGLSNSGRAVSGAGWGRDLSRPHPKLCQCLITASYA